MRFTYLAFFQNASGAKTRISDADLALFRAAVQGLAGLSQAHFYTPETAQDIYNNDGVSPAFGIQLYFDCVEAMEAAIASTGKLYALAQPGVLASLDGLQATQQAMVVRRFPVAETTKLSPTACSYVVHYPGPAEDYNTWIAHYIAYHPPIMKRFPAVREIEILTRMDWTDAMPWQRMHHMQRNRIMFDSPADLTAALQSPVRHEMRADYTTFPPYQGGNFHYPMATERVVSEKPSL